MNKIDSFDSLQYAKYGKPEEVLELKASSLSDCEEGEVIIRMELATIHPSDVGLIQGSYGTLRDLPAIGGREGVGLVYQVGKSVDENLLGRPVCLPDAYGCWQEFIKIKADQLIFLPSLVPLDQLAVSVLNPLTAWRLLNDFEYLKPGDFVVQNAGNSAVGIAVAQFAKKMGLECLSLVRSEAMRRKLGNFLGAKVLIDQDSSVEEIIELTKGRGCALALNSIGGRSSLRLAKCLSDGAVHVTFGAMDGALIRFPTRALIFKDIRFVGFWLDRWKKSRNKEEIKKSIDEVLEPLALTEISHPIDSIFQLNDFKNALIRNGQSRFGKVLLCRDQKMIKKFTDLSD